jgi:hypothetical protein
MEQCIGSLKNVEIENDWVDVNWKINIQ